MLRKVVLSCLIVIAMVLNSFMLPVFAAPSSDDAYNAKAVASIMAKTNVFELKAKSAVLMDAASGSILQEQNSHERLPIASVTKVMSMLLIMEAIDSGKLTFEERVTVSEFAAGYGGSQAYIEAGEEFSVSDMMKAIAIHSSNDVTLAMAEKIAGSEDLFVSMMNDKAKELGMKDTHFLDCVGLNTDGYSTAYDVAVMSREIINKHPKILEFTSIWHDTFRNGTFSLDNTNKLVHFYPGCDGLKTGYIKKAGYCLSATVKRNNLRLITVVLGEPDSNTRFAETRKLMDYGFANYEIADVNKKGEEVNTVEVKKGVQTSVKGIIAEDVSLSIKKGEKDKIVRDIVMDEELTAPVKAGQKIGKIIYKVGDTEVGSADILAETDVEKASFIRLFFRMILKWFGVGRG